MKEWSFSPWPGLNCVAFKKQSSIPTYSLQPKNCTEQLPFACEGAIITFDNTPDTLTHNEKVFETLGWKITSGMGDTNSSLEIGPWVDHTYSNALVKELNTTYFNLNGKEHCPLLLLTMTILDAGMHFSIMSSRGLMESVSYNFFTSESSESPRTFLNKGLLDSTEGKQVTVFTQKPSHCHGFNFSVSNDIALSIAYPIKFCQSSCISDCKGNFIAHPDPSTPASAIYPRESTTISYHYFDSVHGDWKSKSLHPTDMLAEFIDDINITQTYNGAMSLHMQ